MMNKNRKINGSLTDFYLSYIDKLYANPTFKKQTLNRKGFLKLDRELSEKEVFEKILKARLEQAELTLSLVKDLNFTKEDLLLEIGCGVGFAYGFLKKQGFNIYGIEPSSSGADGFFNSAIQMFKIIGIDKNDFYPLFAKECTKLNRQFDVIFSNGVLEHISELEQSFLAMKNVLKPDGLMIHSTVNYFIPYEPHFNMMLFPLFPKFTALLKPSLKKSSIWNGLNFITTKKLKSLCQSSNLDIKFKRDTLRNTFLRLDTDPEFAMRQKYFVLLYKVLKLTRSIKFLDKIPVALTTPITFTITKTRKMKV